jgi:hypothetical protein
MASNPACSLPAEQPHSLRLLMRLLDLGIIARGKFTRVHIRHDDDCPALISGSDCRCDCEVEIEGHRYLFSEFVHRARP